MGFYLVLKNSGGYSLDQEAEAVGPKRSSSEIDHESKQKKQNKKPQSARNPGISFAFSAKHQTKKKV